MTATYKYLPSELADRLRHLGLAVRCPVEGPLQGLHRSPHYGASVEFADYREYTPGDPPQRIDWAVFARSDRYVIRRYQEETNLRAYLVLDISESMAFREQGTQSKLDYAAFLAAGLMYILVNQGDSVGCLLFNEGIQQRFAPVGTLEGLRPLLLHLETIQPSGRSRIEQALHHTAEQLQSRSLVILISDLLQPPGEILRGIRHLRHQKHEVMVLHVLDGAELCPEFSGFVELRELETNARLLVHGEEIREAYTDEVRRYLEELRRGCVEALVDYRVVDTRQPLEAALRPRTTRS